MVRFISYFGIQISSLCFALRAKSIFSSYSSNKCATAQSQIESIHATSVAHMMSAKCVRYTACVVLVACMSIILKCTSPLIRALYALVSLRRLNLQNPKDKCLFSTEISGCGSRFWQSFALGIFRALGSRTHKRAMELNKHAMMDTCECDYADMAVLMDVTHMFEQRIIFTIIV